MKLTPYLLFDGSCKQAMQFYHSVLGGELDIIAVKDSPAKDHLPASLQDRILNASLTTGDLSLSASDWLRPDQTPQHGNLVCLYLSGNATDLKRLFDRLSEGAEVTDPLKQHYGGQYGALNDKFGVRWMFHE